MYPGIACNKKIPIHKSKVDYFNQSEDFALVASLLIPPVNIVENKDNYVIIIATPGLQRDDFCIEFKNSILTISGKKDSTTTQDTIDRCEYDLTEWTRTFKLPNDAEAILAHADYLNGELIIHIPRSDSVENKEKATIYVY